MKTHARILKWGNGLALRVAGPMRDVPYFQEGMDVEIEITGDGFTVKKSDLGKNIFPFSEKQLLESLKHEHAHANELATLLPRDFEQ